MSFSEASNIITQTGTDTDLSGLNGVTGVTRYVEEDMIIYDVASTHRFIIEGTVHHDPEKEVLIIRHDWVSGDTPAMLINYGTNAWKYPTAITRDSDNRFVLTLASHGYQVGDAVEFQVTETGAEHLHQVVYPVTAVTTDTFTLGMTEYSDYLPTLSGATNRVTRRAVYNYGREITAFGNTRLSAGTGLLFVGNKENNFQERGSGIKVSADGLFRGRGGAIYSSRPTALNGYSDIDGTELVSPTLLDCRSMSGGAVKNFKLVNNQVSGAHVGKLLNRGFVLSDGVLMETLSQSYYEAVLRDLDTSNNTGDADIGHSSNDTYPHRDWIIINSKAGSSIRGMYRSSTGLDGSAQKGVTVVKKEVSFNLKDSSGSAIQGVEMYMSDTPDPNYSKNATFPAPTDTNRQYPSSLGTNTLGVLNANGTATYDYTNAIEYTGTSDASGLIDTIQVTTGVQILEYLSTDPSASSQGGNGGPYNITLDNSNRWIDSNGNRPTTEAWDTTEFGGFYKVDRRGNGNTDADLFTFNFCSYDHSLSSSTQALKGLGELEVDWVLVDDQLITDTKVNADAYTEIDTPQKFYNRAKAYLVDDYAGETATIVSREGNSIDAGSYDVEVDGSVTNASSAFAISGNKLTIKATRFVGNIATTGATTTINGAEVIGTFGSTTVLPWEVKNVEGTSRIQLVNVTQNNTEVVNTKLTSTDPFIDASGTYTASQIAVGDVVRLRVTCVVGDTALLPVLQTGVATSTGITFQVDQEADTVYNSNGINGSTITTLTADYTNPMGVDVSDADGTASVKEIYAFFTYSTTTADGVENWFGGMRAIDNANYEVVTANADIKIQNIGSNAVVVTDGRMFRDDGNSILYAEDNDKPITMDSGALVTNIQPMVEAGLNANAKISSINNNSKLIPGLL